MASYAVGMAVPYIQNAVAGMKDKIQSWNGFKRTWKVHDTYSVQNANIWWKEKMGYNIAPYNPDTFVEEIKLLRDTPFVRVYDGSISQ